MIEAFSLPGSIVVGTYNLSGHAFENDRGGQLAQIKRNILEVKPDLLAIQGISKQALIAFKADLERKGYSGQQAEHTRGAEDAVAVFYRRRNFTLKNKQLYERAKTRRCDLYIDLEEKISKQWIRFSTAHIISGAHFLTGGTQLRAVLEDLLKDSSHIAVSILAVSFNSVCISCKTDVLPAYGFQTDDDDTVSCVAQQSKLDWIYARAQADLSLLMALEGHVYDNLKAGSHHHLVTTKIQFSAKMQPTIASSARPDQLPVSSPLPTSLSQRRRVKRSHAAVSSVLLSDDNERDLKRTKEASQPPGPQITISDLSMAKVDSIPAIMNSTPLVEYMQSSRKEAEKRQLAHFARLQLEIFKGFEERMETQMHKQQQVALTMQRLQQQQFNASLQAQEQIIFNEIQNLVQLNSL